MNANIAHGTDGNRNGGIQEQNTATGCLLLLRVSQEIELPANRCLRLSPWRTAGDRPSQQSLQIRDEVRVS